MSDEIDIALTCKCGKHILMNCFPRPHVSRIIREGQYLSLSKPLEAHGQRGFFLQSDLLITCPNCDRLLLQTEKEPGFITYVREPEYDRILQE